MKWAANTLFQTRPAIKYGVMEASDIKRLKEQDDENCRLKAMFADLSLEHSVLKDIVEKKSCKTSDKTRTG